MPIAIRMPALSPTMEQGKLARWLVKEGDSVTSGDILAEIETDKATMEFEAVDEGTVGKLVVPEGTEGVKVGAVIALIEGEDGGEEHERPAAPEAHHPPTPSSEEEGVGGGESAPPAVRAPSPAAAKENRVIASPLARRLAAEKGLDLAVMTGSGPRGRIVKSDVDAARPGEGAAAAAPAPQAKPAPANDAPPPSAPPPAAPPPAAPPPAAPPPAAPPPAAAPRAPEVQMADATRALLDPRVPHTVAKLSGMRKTIARRLAQSMSEAPHIYLTVDIRLDRLLAMRAEMNAALEKQGVKLSVNDMLIKALGKALIDVPECNVTFAGNELISYSRADVSVAVSIPGGLITPIVRDANGRSLSSIAQAMQDLGARARAGKLTGEEYQGGTASLSNMGMMGIKHFTAVINPPQSTILAIGAGGRRPWVMPDDSLGVATVMTATGSFDHRAVDGADGARLMAAFKGYVESPLGMVV